MGFSAIAAATVAAGAMSAYSSSQASKRAASAQQDAAGQATAAQQQALSEMRGDLQPYRDMGLGGMAGLTNALTGPNGTYEGSRLGTGQPVYSENRQYTPINYQYFQPTMAQLEQTPGYQFTLRQGLNAVDNSAASRGLAGSGAQQKALADYASGLASTTYQQQLQNYMAQFGTDLNARVGQFNTGLQAAMGQSELAFNQGTANDTNLYNRLAGLAGIGQNAAAQSGAGSVQTGTGIASNLIGAGNAAASGYIGSANALNQGLGSAANGISQGYMMNRLFASPAPDPSVTGTAAG